MLHHLQYGASVANNATVQRGIEFKSGRKTVLVQISGARFALSITANGTQFTGAGTALLGGGVTMQVTNFSPPAMGVLRRVTVHAGGCAGPPLCGVFGAVQVCVRMARISSPSMQVNQAGQG